MKEEIEQLKHLVAEAKTRHIEASKDIKRVEKDMKDFDNNKDSKLAELQKSIESSRKSHGKASASAKELQKELLSARLEAEQAGADLGAAQDQLEESGRTLKSLESEVLEFQQEQKHLKVYQRY